MLKNQVKGKLHVVATPIGNLEDISIRAKRTLSETSWIACEDTRHSRRLLDYMGIKKPLYPLHEFNEKQKANELIEKLKNGESGALISDAGTPLISDPGFDLIKLAYQADIQVVPIPGACALITALSALGIGTHHFYFEGFLPPKASARLQRLQALKSFPETLVFYEAPHRIHSSLKALQAVFEEDRVIGVARELTKKFESFYRAPLSTLDIANIPEKGEFVLVLEGAPKAAAEPQTEQFKGVLTVLMRELPLKQAVKLTCDITGAKKNDVYNFALMLQLS